MPKRIDELEKTWTATRGSTVFNTYGNMFVPYGRNRLYVSGRGGSGNCPVPGNIATYTGNSAASYNSGVAATYNPGFTASYTGNSANYNFGNPASYTGNTVIPASGGNNAIYNPCGTGFNPAVITGYNSGSTGGAQYNAGNITGYNVTNIAGYNVGVGTTYNPATPGGYNTRNINGYNTGTATYTPGVVATYNSGSNNIASYTGNSANYNTGNPVGFTSNTISGYNSGSPLTYNPPTVNWYGVIVETIFDEDYFYYEQIAFEGNGTSVGCPVQGSGIPVTPSNFPNFPGFVVGGGAQVYSYEIYYTCSPAIPGTPATYTGNSANYNTGNPSSFNVTNISGYNPGVAATYNTGVIASYTGNFVGGYTGNSANYNTGNPSGFTAGNAITYADNNANYNQGSAIYNAGNINSFVGNSAVFTPGTPFTDCSFATISGYNPPGSADPNYNTGNPASFTPTNIGGYNSGNALYNTGVGDYNTGSPATYNPTNVAGYNSGNAVYNPGIADYNTGNPATYTGNFTATFNAPGAQVYNEGSIANYIGNNATGVYNPGSIANYVAGNIANYNPGTVGSYTGNNIAGYNSSGSTEVYNAGTALYNAGTAATYNEGTVATYNEPTIGGYNEPTPIGGGGCCFAGDTLISMADGSNKTIETIQVGDQILSYNPDTGEHETNEVSEIITRVNRVMFEYILENSISVRASDDHPFFVIGKGYASMNPNLTMQGYRSLESVAQVQVGDSFVDKNGDAIRINAIVSINYPYTVYTFNNKYKSSPNFYANGVLTY
jgi:hypothetical protein